ncbi:hypothetical protein HDU97_008536 [Phlyctochytrium planicorne]|nr:hypothetical protein HDU97_008536 [Phlyctochytrium planicorne]
MPQTETEQVDAIWANVNLGWLVMKIVEVTAVALVMDVLPNHKLVKIIRWTIPMNFIHNATAYTINDSLNGLQTSPYQKLSFYLGVLAPEIKTNKVWIIQAVMAAFVRIVEFVVNYYLVLPMTKHKSLWIALNVIASVGVLFGRIYDVFNPFIEMSTIRTGMAVVSASGCIPAIFAIYTFGTEYLRIRRLSDGHAMSAADTILFKSIKRLAFINFIDIALICCFLWIKQHLWGIPINVVFDNLDNGRIFLLLFDIVLSNLMGQNNKSKATSQSDKGSAVGAAVSRTANGASVNGKDSMMKIVEVTAIALVMDVGLSFFALAGPDSTKVHTFAARFYLGVLAPEVKTSKYWIIQAVMAGSVRIVEFVVNYYLVLPMITQKTLWISLNVIASIGVMAGRIYDVFNPFIEITTIRTGMAIVSASGCIPSIYAIYILASEFVRIRKFSEGAPLSGPDAVLLKSIKRLSFINFIDIALIFCFLWVKQHLWGIPIYAIVDNLDNGRIFLLLFDIVLSNLMGQNCRKSQLGGTADKGSNMAIGPSSFSKGISSFPARESRDVKESKEMKEGREAIV